MKKHILFNLHAKSRLLAAGFLCLSFALSLNAADWGYRTAHNYHPPLEDGIQLTGHGHLVRTLWSHEDVHTGISSSSAGKAINLLAQGFDPTYGETSAAVVVDGVYILSWSEVTGDVSARPESITDRYHRGEENYEALKDTYFRIDANWNTLALNAETGEKLWKVSQPSASLNFQSSKRGHNGLDPVAGNGIYVTLTITGRVYAYDIATGELRWETNLGEWHERAEAYKAEALAERNLPVTDDGPFGNVRSGAAMVGDKVILPDLRGGLIAVRAEDGSQIWHLDEAVMNGQGNPRLWEHGGKTYMITHTIHQPHNRVHLIDPEDASILWTHETGFNPGKLLIGEDMVLLNPDSDRRTPALLAAYRITLDGLERQWRFPDDDSNRVPTALGGSRSWERKGVIANGFLYMAIGQPNEDRRTASFDLATGEELHRGDYRPPNNNIGQPFVHGDKLYWHISSTGAQNAGLYIYQRHGDGTIELLDEFHYRPLGVTINTDYLHPTDYPMSNGRIFLRGYTNILAIDLREPAHTPVEFLLENGWAGFHRPMRTVLIPNENRGIELARLEVPPRRELGVVGTTARRNDVWSRIDFDEELKIGGAWDTNATVHLDIFSWPAHIVMEEAEGNEWRGQWTRTFPGWEETLTREGTLHEVSEGGYPSRGWPTGWLEHQPVTFFTDLEEGQERVFLQIFGSLPRVAGDFQNMTLCLDHDGEKVVSAVAGGFRYNQSYHEVDASGLKVTPEGITGTARIILNGDPWLREPDWKNGGSLMGLLTVDARFGEANDKGVYPITGDWTLEWGVSGELTGKIHANLND
ncbi:MAG: PQQ-binding-like beta-propeller repeat protein [Verrucomicrobia bacterium]|nr:PQQ-binding-like beta-propeller repeat protein [Verrucomicrobiota bacterium]MCH8511940.1 PQQ-binding-like beta-propeller repeat protein [Kiritimatiellia bacterium]